MGNIREAFRTLEGQRYDARTFEDAVASLRRTYSTKLSAEYTVERLMHFANRAGWIKSEGDDPRYVRIVVT